ncbi:Sec7-domain-containing protein [Meira miltonrushii]|uniref:Sec7-domain-containing protein n=1 Tax=Meira miltonrushii TaxID=1280837 RepID=A0A316VC35_9BASI|nr:Sec7-domain-containing protein [Meira miltonrushii]PWN34678.1 Sec7-domain-containing protein [Meira miltonrushii]
MHLVYSEINAVTSAIRKHARNTASSSASLVPVLSSKESSSKSVQQKQSQPDPIAEQANRSAHARNKSLDYAISPTPTESSTFNKAARLRYVYADNRRDDSLVGLLNAFTLLRAQLKDIRSLEAIPQPLLLQPFLRVILSARTTGPVTSIALQAVHRLIIYGIIQVDLDHPTDGGILASRQDGRDHSSYLHRSSSQLAVAEIAHAVSHCRFEASDAVADELVLLRILAVMRELICNDGRVEIQSDSNATRSPNTALADCLSDESICEMMETGLSMCCQMRLSDLLRRTAEQSMTTMVRSLFSRLGSIPLTADESYSSGSQAPEIEPEHATLAADPVGKDLLDAEKEKKLRRMTMPDPKSFDVPAAGLMSPPAVQEMKTIGEQEELEPSQEKDKVSTDESDVAKVEGGEKSNETISTEAPSTEATAEKPAEENSTPQTLSVDDALNEKTASNASETNEQPEEDITEVDSQPYGLPAIKEVLKVIVSLLDPNNQQHTDSMRLLGLSMLCAVFEVAGKSIGLYPSLRAVVQDSACKHLFHLTRSENPTLVAYSLRTTSTLFETMREHLKLQYESFIAYIFDRLAPTFPISAEPWKDDASNVLAMRRANLNDIKRTGTPDVGTPNAPPPPPPPPLPKTSDRSPAHGESRELVIETLSLLLGSHLPFESDHDAFVELWINYDCDVDCDNMFEKMVNFLCRSVYAANPLHPHVQESTQLFAIDALLNLVSNMAARQESEAAGVHIDGQWPEELPAPEQLAGQKGTKASILAGAAKFNEKPKLGLKYFEERGFIDSTGKGGVTKDVSIARFLKDCPGLDKRLLGDYLSRPENEGVLDAFLRLFDFSQTPIAEAMREMLEAFRLPGESQQINRITETFAKIFFASKPAEIHSEDAVYVLSYSIIMLNTDLHNPQNKRRMTIEDYRRNLRGVNDGKDFDQEFLGAIYDSIRRREIVMPEEHKGQLGFDYAWKELLRRSRKSGKLLHAHTTRFDRDMFAACWRPIVASIAYAFSTYRDEHLLERAISGFRQCAVLASRFDMHELFDFTIQGLASATGLLDANGVGQVTNNAVVEFEGQKVTISPLSIQFGRNFKGQLAAVVLFTIANGNGHAVRKGWLPIFEIYKNLFINSLLSSSLGSMFEFGTEKPRPLPIRAKRAPGPPPQDPRSQSGAGIFSTISSYLLSPYSTEKEITRPDVTVTEEAVESSLCTADCVASCRIEDLFTELMQLNLEARIEALQALRQLADRYTVERRAMLIAEGTGNGESSSGRSTPTQGVSASNGPPLRSNQALPYDPCGAFVLELAVTLACSANPQDANKLWPIVAEHSMSIIGSPGHYHSLQVERAVVAILRLVQYASPQSELRQQIFQIMDSINGLPVEYRATMADQVTAGLYSILNTNPKTAVSKTEWSIILTMLAIYGNARSAKAAHYSLACLESIIRMDAASDAITVENFSGIVYLLRDFARSADTIRLDSGQQNGGDQQSRKTLTEKKALREYEEACQQRGPKAVEYLEMLKARIPRLSSQLPATSITETWTSFWSPLMLAIAQQYTNGHRATRQAALTHLQRILLAPEIVGSGEDNVPETRSILHSMFGTVLFPTLNELLKPEVYQLDASNEAGSMQETRIRSCNLLCKVYLHYLGRLSNATVGGKSVADVTGSDGQPIDEDFLQLWLTILDFFDRFMHSGKRDQLTESTPENLKNVLLVMNASGILLPPPSQGEAETRSTGQAQLFDKTFERIQRFLPKLKDEIFVAAPISNVQTPKPSPQPAPENNGSQEVEGEKQIDEKKDAEAAKV